MEISSSFMLMEELLYNKLEFNWLALVLALGLLSLQARLQDGWPVGAFSSLLLYSSMIEITGLIQNSQN